MKKLPLALLFLASICVAASGCSDPEAEAAIESCQDFCVNQGNASSCPDSVADETDQCSDLCSFVVNHLSDDCQIKAQVYYSCSASMDTWMCGMGGNLPLASDDSCQPELDAYAPCFYSED
jgi:hypothetical protein